MIGIGINQFCVLSAQTKVNEDGLLELHFKTKDLGEDEVMQFITTGKEIPAGTGRILLFPPNKTVFGTEVRKSKGQLSKDLQDYQKMLTKFLKIYMKKEEIEKEFPLSVVVNVASSSDAFVNGLSTDNFVDKAYTFISEKFVEVCKNNNILDSTVESFRLKLWRQSEAKNFPRIPGGFGEWIESMRVPEELSALKPTDYEIKNNKLKADAVESDNVPKETQEKTATLFDEDKDELPFKND